MNDDEIYQVRAMTAIVLSFTVAAVLWNAFGEGWGYFSFVATPIVFGIVVRLIDKYLE